MELEKKRFLLVACNIGERRELQKCQNNALGICAKFNVADHVRIDYLHSR